MAACDESLCRLGWDERKRVREKEERRVMRRAVTATDQ